MWYCKKLFQLVIKDSFVWASYVCGRIDNPLFLNADVYGMNYARLMKPATNTMTFVKKKAGTYQKDARTLRGIP